MTTPTHPFREPAAGAREGVVAPQTIDRVAVGVNGYPEGHDAAALGAAIAKATGAAIMLVAVHPDPIVVVPEGLNWTTLHKQAQDTLTKTRDALAPGARLEVRTDHSVARALHRVVQREDRDLLVLGSNRHASEGHVSIGKRTRQLLCHFECPLAIAARGLHGEGDVSLKRIGVGYDGEPESQSALAWAARLAPAAGAELRVRAVVDDRMPRVGWGQVWIGDMMREWMETVREEQDSLRKRAEGDAHGLGVPIEAEAVTGRPADALRSLSGEVDLLVIGSRRWGPAQRLLLGSTGEAVMHDAACSIVAVPRPTH
ncbi:MAG: universal stress protein [Solirubrobacteraceae bacterium]